LDELTHGLDVEEREWVFTLACQPVPGRLILYSTHEPADAGRLADRVIVLCQGEATFFGEVDDFCWQDQDEHILVEAGE